MAINDGILDVSTARIGAHSLPRKFSSSVVVNNPQTKIYYNSTDDVIKIEEILYAGTANETMYTQVFNYIPAVASGVARTTIIESWTGPDVV
jgi:hypothetical protein